MKTKNMVPGWWEGENHEDMCKCKQCLDWAVAWHMFFDLLNPEALLIWPYGGYEGSFTSEQILERAEELGIDLAAYKSFLS